MIVNNQYRTIYNKDIININNLYDRVKKDIDFSLFDELIKKYRTKSKHKRERFVQYFSMLLYEDFPKNRINKYGNINKGFEKEEWEIFIENEDHFKAKFAWQIQYLRGLRIGEIITLNLENINWKRKTIKVWTLKAQQWDEVVIEGEFELLLKNWIETYKNKINEAKGYLFFSDNPSINRQYLSENWLRKQFGITRKKINLDQIYNFTKESQKNRISRPQYILTTHSLRHAAITNFYNKSLDIIATMKFARHKDIKSTLVYVRTDINRIRNALQNGIYDQYGDLIKKQIKEAVAEAMASTTTQEISCDRED